LALINKVAKPRCGICQNDEGNKTHIAREMMLGFRKEFEYLECENCGTVQIKDIPDLSLYYPKDYYSFNSPECPLANNLKSKLAARLARRYFLQKKNLLGKYIAETRSWTTEYFPQCLNHQKLNLNVRSSILDFGCGNGTLLNILNYFGFRNLTGVDAFIEKDIFYKNGVRVFKRDLKDIKQTFDLAMLNHSFEHLPNPQEILREIHRLLKPDNYALIRMPVVAYAWKKYGVNWVQLDPPRHLFLYTEKTFCPMAEKEGFEVEDVVYDSTEFQFLGSEQYLQDIPLTDERSPFVNPQSTLFSEEQIKEWKNHAIELNAKKEGDQACYYLKKVK